jgi:hypothetical protein
LAHPGVNTTKTETGAAKTHLVAAAAIAELGVKMRDEIVSRVLVSWLILWFGVIGFIWSLIMGVA